MRSGLSCCVSRQQQEDTCSLMRNDPMSHLNGGGKVRSNFHSTTTTTSTTRGRRRTRKSSSRHQNNFINCCTVSSRRPFAPIFASSSLLSLTLLFIISILIFSSADAAITEQCLACICHASSGCDSSLKCHNDGNGGYFCGAYQISWGYWSDAGKMGSRGGPNDFESCLNNKICAEATIVSYMNKYAIDCNQDGSVDCMDFAAIHKAGPKSCNADWFINSVYWRKFQETPCFRRLNPNRSSRDFFLEEILPPRGRDRINGFTPAAPPPGNSNFRPPLDRPGAVGPPPRFDQPPPASVSFPSREEGPVIRPRGNQPPFVNRAPSSRVSWSLNSTSNPPNAFNAFTEPDRRFNNGNSDAFFPPQPAPIRSNVPPNNGIRRLPSPASFRSNGPPSESRRRFDEPVPNRFENFNNNNNNAFFVPPNNNLRNFAPPNNFRPPVNNNNNNNFGPRPGPPVNINNSRAVIPVNNNSPPPINRPAFSQPDPGPTPVRPNSEGGFVPASCLSCLCHAATGCDLNRQCVGDFCGPYLISWNYWTDAGRPGNDFTSCALNRKCAEDAIHAYMKKWTRDCNGDGIVDCDDFAAIHKLGPHMCRSEAITSTAYWREYEKCDSSVRRPSGSNNNNNNNNNHALASVGSPSSVVGDLRRPERGFNDIPLLPDHESRGPGSFGGNTFFNGNNNNGNANGNTFVPRTPSFSFPAAFSFGGENSRPRIHSDAVTTPRPPLDLPLITPRRRLYAPSAENSENSPREGRTLDPDAGSNNLIDVDRNKPPARQDMSKECMECICDASSGCDLRNTCPLDNENNRHLQQTCGPYQIDRNYWSVAGRLGRSFESCANEKPCAEESVSRFVHQMAFDCNEDGVIDCLDYASIHRAGPKSCNSQWFLDSPYWSTFEQCYGFGRR